MSRRTLCLLSLLSFAALLPSAPRALNPIIQTIYSTDPAPAVFGDRLYVYTGHDEDGATTFVMKNWWVFSTADMVNWTAHGSPLSLASFPFAARDAWAGQVVAREVDVGGGTMATRYFWYVPVRTSSGATAIGVAVSDSPTGPFVNAILNQNPDALYVSIFGSDWINFVRESLNTYFGSVLLSGTVLESGGSRSAMKFG